MRGRITINVAGRELKFIHIDQGSAVAVLLEPPIGEVFGKPTGSPFGGQCPGIPFRRPSSCGRCAVGMPVGLPATETMVRLGAQWLLRTDPELALYGRYVTSQRLSDEGFVFSFPGLVGVLSDLL